MANEEGTKECVEKSARVRRENSWTFVNLLTICSLNHDYYSPILTTSPYENVRCNQAPLHSNEQNSSIVESDQTPFPMSLICVHCRSLVKPRLIAGILDSLFHAVTRGH